MLTTGWPNGSLAQLHATNVFVFGCVTSLHDGFFVMQLHSTHASQPSTLLLTTAAGPPLAQVQNFASLRKLTMAYAKFEVRYWSREQGGPWRPALNRWPR
jgi:hypothetical protein